MKPRINNIIQCPQIVVSIINRVNSKNVFPHLIIIKLFNCVWLSRFNAVGFDNANLKIPLISKFL